MPILGILSILFALIAILPFFGLLSLIGLGLGIVALNKREVVTGVVGVVLSVLMMATSPSVWALFLPEQPISISVPVPLVADALNRMNDNAKSAESRGIAHADGGNDLKPHENPLSDVLEISNGSGEVVAILARVDLGADIYRLVVSDNHDIVIKFDTDKMKIDFGGTSDSILPVNLPDGATLQIDISDPSKVTIAGRDRSKVSVRKLSGQPGFR